MFLDLNEILFKTCMEEDRVHASDLRNKFRGVWLR